MGTLWFWLVAAMLIAYVVFDGFDLGVGIVYLFVARTEPERQQSLRSIGPVWDGLLCTRRHSAAFIFR
jgi:cytochrome d ubiquinol oxidase subunit II